MADRKRKPDTDAYFVHCGGGFYRCKICNAILIRGINEARDHVVTHDATLHANLNDYRMPRLGPRVSCDRCNKTFCDTPAGRAQLSKHQVCCGDAETVCSRCGDDFKKPQWLRSHMVQNPRCVWKREADERILMGREDRPA